MAGINIGDVGGNVEFQALGDIVGGHKFVSVTNIIQISTDSVTKRPLTEASPYRGLRRFDERDRDLFFGRDQTIRSLLQRLSSKSLVVLLGPSGSGKSSLVRAGLLPELGRLMGQRLRYFVLAPDTDPFESLRASLMAGGLSQTETIELAQPDLRNIDAMSTIINSRKQPGEQWLFFIDQFEETFTRTLETRRKLFTDTVLSMTQDENGSTKVIATMRSDFLGSLSAFPRLAKRVQAGIEILADMHDDDLRLAIEQPAARHGVVLESGLVEEIVRSIHNQPGQLPLLQSTLNSLWEDECRSGGLARRILTTRAYRELGGVLGALEKQAETMYATLADERDVDGLSERDLVRRILLRLVDLPTRHAEEYPWRPVRRRIPLTAFGNSREEEALQVLVERQLVVIGSALGAGTNAEGATVEVAHESLFTSWPRLRSWIDDAQQVIFMRGRLADDARKWSQVRAQKGNSDDELWTGSRLDEALQLYRQDEFTAVGGSLCSNETAFLSAADSLSSKRSRQRERRQRLGYALIVIVASLALLATYQWWTAARATRSVEERELAQQGGRAFALAQQPGHEVDALLIAIDAVGRSHDNDYSLSEAVHNGLASAIGTAAHPIAILRAPKTSPLMAAVFSPDDRQVVTGGTGGELALWTVPSGRLLREVRTNTRIVAISFAPDGSRVLALSDISSSTGRAPSPMLWKLSATAPQALEEHETLVLDASFSPNENTIVTAGKDGSVKMWDSSTGEFLRSLPKHSASVNRVSFSHDGRLFLTADVAGLARVWSSSGEVLCNLQSDQPIVDAIFSPDGMSIAIGEADGKIHFWTADCKNMTRSLDGHYNLAAVDLSPDGKNVLFTGNDGSARLFSSDQEMLLYGDGPSAKSGFTWRVFGAATVTHAARFSHNGQKIVSAGWGQDVKVLDGFTGRQIARLVGHSGQVTYAAFSNDDRTIVTASKDGTARLWTLSSDELPTTLISHKSAFVSASFASGDEEVVTAGRDDSIRIWDARSGGLKRPFNHPVAIQSGSLSPTDSRYYITTASDHKIRRFDLVSGDNSAVPIQTSELVDAVFSADGRRVLVLRRPGTPIVYDETLHNSWRIKDYVTSGTGALSPDGSRVFLAGMTGELLLVDVNSGRHLAKGHIYAPHIAPVAASASYSPDGRTIVVACGDHNVVVLDSSSLDHKLSLQGHTAAVLSASYSSDGRHIVTAGEDHAIRVWDASSGSHLFSIAGVSGVINKVMFSSDGGRILAAGSDGTARVYSTDASEMLSLACRLLQYRAERTTAAKYCTFETIQSPRSERSSDRRTER